MRTEVLYIVRDWNHIFGEVVLLPLRQHTTSTNHEALFDMFWLCPASEKELPIFLGIEIKPLTPSEWSEHKTGTRGPWTPHFGLGPWTTYMDRGTWTAFNGLVPFPQKLHKIKKQKWTVKKMQINSTSVQQYYSFNDKLSDNFQVCQSFWPVKWTAFK